MKFILTDNDFTLTTPFSAEQAQVYLNQYGCYDDKKPKKKDEFIIMLGRLVSWDGKDGDKIYKEIAKRISETVKDINKIYPDLVPAYIPDLPDKG